MKNRKWKSIVTTALCLGLVSGGSTTALAAVTKDIKTDTLSSTQTATTASNPMTLFFYSDDPSYLNSTLYTYSTTTSDDSLTAIQTALNNGSVQIQNKSYQPGTPLTPTDLSAAREIAFPINMVINNESLQNSLNQVLNAGKRVYLYGSDGITLSEYKDLLHLDNLNVFTEEQGEVDLAKDPSTEKEEVKDNPELETAPNEDKYNVIGYTKNPNPLQLITNTMTNGYTDEYFGEVPSSLQIENFYQEVVDNVTQNKILEDEIGPMAANVASSPIKYKLSSYISGVLRGKVVSWWKLYKDTDETEKNYDHFYVSDYTQLLTYNQGYAVYLKTDHDIPLSPDSIEDWGPHDSDGPSYSINLGYPWGASLGFTMPTSPKVDDISNSDLDYARWVVTDSNMSGDIFNPKTEWKSAGTFATMDIRHWAKFKTVVGGRSIVSDEVSHKINVDYDY
ncbi:hypothetical protein AN960_09895 [Bacillus sp. FJAT-25509]|uniref:hypothetical protein n=1 Tax=Bacillus sp. FJAT-25509 TaxID=1712029 RepID=UPI0006F9934C|nr:hypothetical protein [Bacillus sp. FJAT-25509]KQL39267.1 hypothetical protein AN960_09895 [Bacillus sp. FJAT-25509]